MRLWKRIIKVQTICKTSAVLFTIALGLSGPPLSAQEMQMEPKTSMKKGMSMAQGQGKKQPMPKSSMQGGSAPADARDPNANSGGFEYRGMGGWEETDTIVYDKFMVDQLEYRTNSGSDFLRWDIQGWRGTDYNKMWFKLEGEDEVSSDAADLELQALYSRAVSAFWDFQIGARYDASYGLNSADDRYFAVVGFQGLAPYWFEMEPALFVSDKGDVSARLTATYDILFSQYVFLQPRLEVNVSATEDRESGTGRGVNDVQIGARLRYQIRREFAPYIGFAWSRELGDTADFTRAEGGEVNILSFIAGLRIWF
jgi:copper resistance protein B